MSKKLMLALAMSALATTGCADQSDDAAATPDSLVTGTFSLQVGEFDCDTFNAFDADDPERALVIGPIPLPARSPEANYVFEQALPPGEYNLIARLGCVDPNGAPNTLESNETPFLVDGPGWEARFSFFGLGDDEREAGDVVIEICPDVFRTLRNPAGDLCPGDDVTLVYEVSDWPRGSQCSFELAARLAEDVASQQLDGPDSDVVELTVSAPAEPGIYQLTTVAIQDASESELDSTEVRVVECLDQPDPDPEAEPQCDLEGDFDIGCPAQLGAGEVQVELRVGLPQIILGDLRFEVLEPAGAEITGSEPGDALRAAGISREANNFVDASPAPNIRTLIFTPADLIMPGVIEAGQFASLRLRNAAGVLRVRLSGNVTDSNFVERQIDEVIVFDVGN